MKANLPRVFLVLLGSTFAISAGAWAWSLRGYAVGDVGQTAHVAPRQRIVRNTTHTPVQRDEKPEVGTDAEGLAKSTSARKRERPEGKNHDDPSAMLHHMAAHLHADAVNQFIDTPGLGFGRMGPMVRLAKRPWSTPWWSQDELDREPPVKDVKDFDRIHLGGIQLFADSNTVPPENRISHIHVTESKEAKKGKLWEIKALDLVGLVMHETPVVYMSEKIPEMKDLADKPTRPLDYFELVGLEHLLEGEPLYVRGKEGTIRVLGPIRAAKACLKCHHDSKEGDLLGAFSYTLREGDYQVTDFRGRPLPPRKIDPKAKN